MSGPDVSRAELEASRRAIMRDLVDPERADFFDAVVVAVEERAQCNDELGQRLARGISNGLLGLVLQVSERSDENAIKTWVRGYLAPYIRMAAQEDQYAEMQKGERNRRVAERFGVSIATVERALRNPSD